MTDNRLQELIGAIPACPELDELQNYLEATLKDAERYRWLRASENQFTEDDPCVSDSSFDTYFECELDVIIDGLIERNKVLERISKISDHNEFVEYLRPVKGPK